MKGFLFLEGESPTLKEFIKGLSEVIFIEVNKRNLSADKNNILTLDVK